MDKLIISKMDIYNIAFENCIKYRQSKIVKHIRVANYFKFGTPLTDFDKIYILSNFANSMTKRFLKQGIYLFVFAKIKGGYVVYDDKSERFSIRY
jgi:hypothetical protein